MNIIDYLNRAGVTQVEQQTAALASLGRSKALAKTIRKYEWSAPFVMAKLVFSLPWEADRLPEQYQKYDTEPLTHIDINGDLKQWIAGPDGVGIPQPLTLERDPLPRNTEGVELCYYAKGHHGRSKWARWVWLGTRNRAQRAAYDLGPVYDPDIQHWHVTLGDETVDVYRMGEHWQILATKRALRFFQVRLNVGFKIKNVMKGDQRTIDPSIPVRASVTYTPWSAKRWKKKKD